MLAHLVCCSLVPLVPPEVPEAERMPPPRLAPPIVDAACRERVDSATDRLVVDELELPELIVMVRDARRSRIGCRVAVDELVARAANSAIYVCLGGWRPDAVELWALAADAATTPARRRVALRNRRMVVAYLRRQW